MQGNTTGDDGATHDNSDQLYREKMKLNLTKFSEELGDLFSSLYNMYNAKYSIQRNEVTNKLNYYKTNVPLEINRTRDEKKLEHEGNCERRDQEVNDLKQKLEDTKVERVRSTEDFRQKLRGEREDALNKLYMNHLQALNKRKADRANLVALSDSDKKNLLEEKEKYEELYRNERRLRRALCVELMDLKGNIHVYCRVRPMLPVELCNKDNSDCVIYPIEGSITIQRTEDASQTFELDHIFRPDSTQEQVFDLVSPFVYKFLTGFNICIFAYGQTGSGKTYTMEGTPEYPGLYNRILKSMFDIAFNEEDSAQYVFKMSILEIYNEKLLDLINYTVKPLEAKKWVGNRDVKEQEIEDRRITLELREGKNGNFVEGLATEQISNMEDAKRLMEKASDNRITASHMLNDHSSRSHLVTTIYMEKKINTSRSTIVSKLNLIDLAGSERVSKTEVMGRRLKEAQFINVSLCALGDVVNALGKSSPHIPYRNSKLTMLLKDSLSGNGKVLMFANVSPVHWNATETISSITFATRCRAVCLGQATANIRPSRGYQPIKDYYQERSGNNPDRFNPQMINYENIPKQLEPFQRQKYGYLHEANVDFHKFKN